MWATSRVIEGTSSTAQYRRAQVNGPLPSQRAYFRLRHVDEFGNGDAEVARVVTSDQAKGTIQAEA